MIGQKQHFYTLLSTNQADGQLVNVANERTVSVCVRWVMTGTTGHTEQFPGVESFLFFLMSDGKCLRASMCIIGHVTPQHVFKFNLSVYDRRRL